MLEAPLNKEHNGGKSSCYQTTGHHAFTELNPLFFQPQGGSRVVDFGGGEEEGKEGVMLHSGECGKSGRKDIST